MQAFFVKKLFLFFRSRQGSVMVEFAILAPVFISFLFAVMQIGFMMIIKNALEQGAYEGARYDSYTLNTQTAAAQNAARDAVDIYGMGLVKGKDVTFNVTTNTFSTWKYKIYNLSFNYQNISNYFNIDNYSMVQGKLTFLGTSTTNQIQGRASSLIIDYIASP